MADPYGGSEDKLTNNKINLIIFQQDLILVSHSDRKLIISELNLPNKDIWFTSASCSKEMGQIVTFERQKSLNLSLTLLIENGLRILVPPPVFSAVLLF
jgi:hypothetical protein